MFGTCMKPCTFVNGREKKLWNPKSEALEVTPNGKCDNSDDAQVVIDVTVHKETASHTVTEK